jgi:phosphoribosylglycinamide formyltransferase-1
MNVGVLASGAGTNLQALIDRVHGRDDVWIVAVASDKPGRTFARERFSVRAERDRAISEWLLEQGVELVVLAGYQQLLDQRFLGAFGDHVINVHPALLPAFPGLNAVEQALAYGVKVFGVTVHFVDGGVDSGPVILQRALELPDACEAAEVLDQLHVIEHDLLVEAVTLIARGALSFDPANPRRVVIAR